MATDKYANIATIQVVSQSANVLTFAELRTQVGIQPDRKTANALIIDEIDYLITATALAEFTANGDQARFAVTVSNSVTDLEDITDRRILHSGSFVRQDFGTAAAATVHKLPWVFQFFPPLITADRSLFLAVHSAGLASALTLRARIYHRVVEIKQTEFIELAEVFRLVG